MAITLGKVNVQDLQINKYKALGIGINRRSNTNGTFAINYSTITQAKDNLINLIMTKKGERIMHPEFGCDIWKVLFEPISDDEIQMKIETSITDAVTQWLPNITITGIELTIDDDLKDNNALIVSIGFALTSNTRIKDELQITIQ
jgi:phage baseplate assembly protein W